MRDLGTGALVGFILGFTLKRMFKLFVLLVGLYLLTLLWLDKEGIIQIEWTRLNTLIVQIANTFRGFSTELTSSLFSMGGFAAGFALGLKA